MMDSDWIPDLARHDGPKYQALVQALRESVRAGTLPEGARLPPVRVLAQRLGITPGTVARAYQIGAQDGILAGTVGRGTYVAAQTVPLGPTQSIHADLAAPEPPSRQVTDLRTPGIPDLGQTREISEALRRVAAQDAPDWLDYPQLRRDLPTRQAVLDWLTCRELGAVGPEDVVLTHGGQSGLTIALQCCLRGDRPVVLIEELAYPGIRHAASLNRAEVVPVALDAEGMIPEALAAACLRHGGRVVVLTPEAQNPTTARMSFARRGEIVAVARAHDLQIIEDDCFTVPQTDLPSLRALAPERGWHVSSLSKSVAAGLRFGALVCPEGRGEAGRLAAQHGFLGLSRIVLYVATEILNSGLASRLRDDVRAIYARQLGMVVQALDGHPLSWQAELPFVWLRLPNHWRASTFVRAAEAEGVLVRSADEYALHDRAAPNAVRIALDGAVTDAALAEALRRLRRLLDTSPDEILV